MTTYTLSPLKKKHNNEKKEEREVKKQHTGHRGKGWLVC